MNWTVVLSVTETAHFLRDQCFLLLRPQTFYVITASCDWDRTHCMWSMLPVTDTAHISRDQCFLWLKQHTFYDASCDRYSTHITWSMLYVAETAQVLRCSCDRYSTHITWSVVSVAETAHFLRDQVFLWLRLCIFYVTRPFSDWDCTHFTSPKAYCHWGCTHSTSPKLYVTDTAHILRHQSFM